MLYYILQTIVFQLLFLLIYDLFLRKETFFNWNRWYLLSTSILSLVLPFIKIERFKGVVSQEFIKLPEVLIGKTGRSASNQEAFEAIGNNALSIWSWELILYIGMFIGAISLIYKVTKIVILISRSEKDNQGRLRIVKLKDSTAAFSFFNYIFLGEGLNEKDRESILKHEIIHVKHWHSLDLVFFEMMRIMFWFNPLIYFYQNRMVAIHEFIADANVFMQQDKITYYQNLLSQVFETKNISFINPFFKQSLIKKRIIMLTKSKSRQINLLKYAILIPVVFGLLVYTSCEMQNEQNIKGELDLSEFSYSLEKGEKLIGDKKAIHDKYEAFLKNNKDYVSWVHVNRQNEVINYSVHHVNEKIPEGFSKSEVSSPDGISYVTYFNWGSPEVQKELTEDEKRKLEQEKLRLKEQFKDALEVPFAIIDEVPIYPGCESLATNEERKMCMSNNIALFVNTNFNTNLGKELELKGRQRINVIFKIGTDGNISGARSRAPHPALEEEAVRVINSLPRFIPGKNNGKNVIVPYSLPILFQVDE